MGRHLKLSEICKNTMGGGRDDRGPAMPKGRNKMGCRGRDLIVLKRRRQGDTHTTERARENSRRVEKNEKFEMVRANAKRTEFV